MLGFIRSLTEKWNNWCGDREMELAIRQCLSKKGYFGNTAQLRNVRLVAVQRPGWLQVFRFEATARVRNQQEDGPDPEPQYDQLYGLVRDDIRHKINQVEVFRDASKRQELYLRWSEDLIQLRGSHGLGQ